jgi:hypothetical protein
VDDIQVRVAGASLGGGPPQCRERAGRPIDADDDSTAADWCGGANYGDGTGR